MVLRTLAGVYVPDDARISRMSASEVTGDRAVTNATLQRALERSGPRRGLGGRLFQLETSLARVVDASVASSGWSANDVVDDRFIDGDVGVREDEPSEPGHPLRDRAV